MFNRMVSVKKTHVLRVNKVGRFALNVVDDLVIVHHQITKVGGVNLLKLIKYKFRNFSRNLTSIFYYHFVYA